MYGEILFYNLKLHLDIKFYMINHFAGITIK